MLENEKTNDYLKRIINNLNGKIEVSDKPFLNRFNMRLNI